MKQNLMICMVVTTFLLAGCGGQNTQNTKISEEEAQSIALTHAGLNDEQVHFITSNSDIDDGKRIYDIEFYSKNGQEYDYEIDSVTGEIVGYDYDVENYRKAN